MLLNSTLDLKEYYGTLNVNTSFKTLKPFVSQATDKYLRPYLGLELLEQLEAGIVANDKSISANSLTGKEKVLYGFLATSLAYYSVLDAMPFLNLTLGDNGAMEQNLQNMSPARQWVYFSGENAAAETADKFLDRALEYLDLNASDFPEWTASEAYPISKESLIANAKDLSRYLNIQGSRRAYLAFKPFLERAELLYIEPYLGFELYENLKNNLQAGAVLTPENAKLLSLVKPALAQFALKESLPELALDISGTGIKVLSENDSIRNRKAADEKQLSSLEVKAMHLGNVYLAEIKRYLDTVLQAGENLPADNQQAWQPIDNTDSQSFWVN